MPEMMVTPF